MSVNEPTNRRLVGGDPTLLFESADIDSIRDRVVEFILATIEDVDADRAVVVLDGGIASAVLATLATDALDPGHVDALVMPAHLSSEAAARDAEALANTLGLEPDRIQLQPLLGSFREVMDATSAPVDDLVAIQNALARFRMACAYYVANAGNGLVFGSATRTDRLLGSVTKHGDIAVDALPFGRLYYTEVCALADELGVSEVVTAAPRDGFGVLPSDAEELGVDDQTLDELLVAAVDADWPPAVVADAVGVSVETVERVAAWHAATAHKRHRPRTPTDTD